MLRELYYIIQIVSAKKKNTKKFILDIAAEAFYRNGYKNTSFSDLIAKTNLSKGAFYHYFKSKKDLCLEVIDIFYEKEVKQEWLTRFHSPLNTINILLKSVENKILNYHQSGDYKYGSALNNLYNEMSYSDCDIKNKLEEAFEQWTSETTLFIKEGQRSDHVKKGFEPRIVAQFFIQNSISALQILKQTQRIGQAHNYFKIIRKTARTFRIDKPI